MWNLLASISRTLISIDYFCRVETVNVHSVALCDALDRREDDPAIEVRLAEAMCVWFPAFLQNATDTLVAPSVVEALERAARFFARPEKAAALRARLAELGIARGENAADDLVVAANQVLVRNLQLAGKDNAALSKLEWLVPRYPWTQSADLLACEYMNRDRLGDALRQRARPSASAGTRLELPSQPLQLFQNGCHHAWRAAPHSDRGRGSAAGG
jgi:hypothetical protein